MQRPARSVLGYLLLGVTGLAGFVLSLLEFFAIWSTATGYWGPEWPNVGHDLAVLTVIWLITLAAVGALLFDRRQRRPRRRRPHEFDRTMRVR